MRLLLQELEERFSRYGKVREARIVRNPRTGESRGFGFVMMEVEEDVDQVSFESTTLWPQVLANRGGHLRHVGSEYCSPIFRSSCEHSYVQLPEIAFHNDVGCSWRILTSLPAKHGSYCWITGCWSTHNLLSAA